MEDSHCNDEGSDHGNGLNCSDDRGGNAATSPQDVPERPIPAENVLISAAGDWSVWVHHIAKDHPQARRLLYVPVRADLPPNVSLDEFYDERHTTLETEWGTTVLITDNWRVEGPVDPGYGLWTGTTEFMRRSVQEQDRQKRQRTTTPTSTSG